ncbi:MAG TPA: hypothetical protein VK545_25995 [Streptomyces sp.]|nr:hypothetical protein [Streptomyces sp.]
MPRRELVAAASRYTSRKLRTKPVDQSWQSRAWDFYERVPEVRFAANWVSNAMSLAVLYAGRRGPDGKVEAAPAGHRAAQLVAEIAGGVDGQAQLLGDSGPHLVVAGEYWLVIRPTGTGAPGEGPVSEQATDPTTSEEWRVLSVEEVRQQGNKLVAEIDGQPVDIPGYDPDNPDPAAPVAIRVWDPYPRRQMEADSPVRTSMELLEELQLLNAAVAAIARSRLTGRGILLVPKGTRFPSTPTQGDAEDDLIELLMTVAETAIREPESAAATVPIILEVPAELIGEFRRLTFESDFDEVAIKLREEAIRRFANGLEIPAEILLGLGDVNHWGAWALTSEAIRLGIEPRLATVVHALTTQWLRPLLEAEGVPDAGEWLVWYDTSPLRVRTNRSETALQVFDRGAISETALRRETGFDESDAPTDEERAARRAATGGTGPGGQDDEETIGQDSGADQAPRLPVDENPREPDTLPASSSALPHKTVLAAALAAADGLIWAALSSAGEKLKRTPACPRSERARAREIDPASLHTVLPVQPGQVEQWRLLEGAWTRVPEIAERYGLEPDCLTKVLDEYCRELIAAGVPHEFGQTAGVLRASCWAVAA